MSIWEERLVRPMLIGADGDAFDDPAYIYELKWDGERCIAYLDPKEGTELRNKRNVKMLSKVPELLGIHKYVNKRCILDGELIILNNGKPDFSLIQRRSLMSNNFKIELDAKSHPASFIAFDILYYGSEDITLRTLMERKALLKKAVKSENPCFAISHYQDSDGVLLYEAAKIRELEGIVAKRRDSVYIQGKRTKDWIKCKYMQDDDYVVCGYIYKKTI